MICNKNFRTKDNFPICNKCKKKKHNSNNLKKLERINNDQWEMLMLMLKESPKSKENMFLEKIGNINKIKEFISTRRHKNALH
jgi:hypothetical protein